MSRIPTFLLPHRITVQPFAGTWGSFGAATSVRCMVQERLATDRAQPGVERIAQITIYAAPDVSLPAGSKVTLPDGRVGHVTASVRHDGGWLPTPDHVEAAVDVASVTGPAFGETVVVIRRTAAGRDRYNNTIYTATEVPVAGAAVRPLSSQETLSGLRDQVTDSLEVILPPGTTITAVDRVRVRGLLYAVDGTPEVVTSSVNGAQPGVRVIARRVSG